MDRFFDIVFFGILFSCFVRHVVRTISFIEDLREKVKNRRSKEFKR